MQFYISLRNIPLHKERTPLHKQQGPKNQNPTHSPTGGSNTYLL